jgi:hypothetical protein
MKALFQNDPIFATRLFGANVVSWFGTTLSLQIAKDVLQIMALAGSIAVSIASVWWINRQARNADRKADK